ncbi:MAG TPA: hypothetical protein VHL08_03340 [Dongiaceae bacterium]|jgi:hypothetical protein|nr:hypothetical protein [Dongiaceae bacterium]
MMRLGSYQLSFDSPLPEWLAVILAVTLLSLVILVLWRRGMGGAWRACAGLLLLVALLQPALIEEERRGEKDIALVLVDQSPSNNINGRREHTTHMLAELRKKLSAFPDLDVRERIFGGEPDTRENGTRLFESWRQALADIKPNHLAGTIILSDGQIAETISAPPQRAPAHLLLTDTTMGVDRHIKLLSAPGFGLLGKEITLKARAEDLGSVGGGQADLHISINGKELPPQRITLGNDIAIPLTITQPGTNIVELSLPAGPREITTINNRAVATIQGVRDHLKVLLVSGEPYPGERMWRNLLKSDPAVDLIHFTILRPANKQDATPISELALIAFPVDELFVEKLKDFDLVIFDRFQHLGLLPDEYFEGIIDYVRKGGAVFEISGPSSAGPNGLARTQLGEILTAHPTGDVRNEYYRPDITPLGLKHPVTAPLDHDTARWGRWVREIMADAGGGQTLMSGIGGAPLLVLNRIDNGRTAQLFSDHLWLWQRGFDGGGPYAELIRRTMHWLMKEPDLEEENLRASIAGERLVIERQSIGDSATNVTVTEPDGQARNIALAPSRPGVMHGQDSVGEEGLYKVSDGKHIAFAAKGSLAIKELEDPRATEQVLKIPVETSGGRLFSWDDGALPEFRRTEKNAVQSGSNWAGLMRNGSYVVTGYRQEPLLPGWLALLLIIGSALMAWWREGR